MGGLPGARAHPRNVDGSLTRLRGMKVTCSCGVSLGPFLTVRSKARAHQDHVASHGGIDAPSGPGDDGDTTQTEGES